MRLARGLQDFAGYSAQFAYNIALEGDVLVVGAYGDSAVGEDYGAAYVFARAAGSWSQLQKLIAFDGASWDYFGGDVGLSGDLMLVDSFR